MVTPELRCPITAATFASTNFWATSVPTLGSPWSSSLIMRKVTGLPAITSLFALACSIASATPFSSSLPWCAIPPVSGPATPLVTVTGAGPESPFDGVGASPRPQAAQARHSDNTQSLIMSGERLTEECKDGQYHRSAGHLQGRRRHRAGRVRDLRRGEGGQAPRSGRAARV